MGDGPGYDYLAEQTERRARTKADQQDRRLVSLQAMILSTGFGENDADNTILEKEAVRHLEIAYALLREFKQRRNRK